ncbi:glycogen synthase GlgA [Bacillus sp. BGMRC 2118]|nr:glycogen synthase GlgA [Bacillus sp. BGMRC 2118]
MNVLFAVSECVPFVKTGGLADVAGSLPQELKSLGCNIAVIMPKYGTISSVYKDRMKGMGTYTVSVGWREQFAGLEYIVEDGITYYFIDNEYYFNREHLYGYYDDGERFSYFCRAVLEALPMVDGKTDIIHCHDWHTGMIPFLLKEQYQKFDSFYHNIKSVFTIHNLKFQGLFPREILHDLLNLDDSYFTMEKVEFHGAVSFMKAAIVSSDYLTTVSPTYCDEIQTPYLGEQLDGLLRAYREKLKGIVNGIDVSFYSPETDSYIPYTYSLENPVPKFLNKKELQRTFQLEENEDTPIITMISRLTEQKGLDLVQHVFDELMNEDIQFIVIGTGEERLEQFFLEMQTQYPNKVRAYMGFNEKLAHLAYAGSDLFLMPSKFEPCGLGQLIAMRYGTVPIVRETGGLNDTVHAFHELDGEGTGFTFSNYNAHDMLYTIKRALSFYKEQAIWPHIVHNAMSQDNSWKQSAFIYHQVYSKLHTPVRSERDVLKQGAVQT